MKTLNELKKVFVGIWIASLMIIPVVYLTDDYSFVEMIEHALNYPEEILMEIGIGIASCMLTYFVWTLYKGIKNDVKEIVTYFKSKKEVKKA